MAYCPNSRSERPREYQAGTKKKSASSGFSVRYGERSSQRCARVSVEYKWRLYDDGQLAASHELNLGGRLGDFAEGRLRLAAAQASSQHPRYPAHSDKSSSHKCHAPSNFACSATGTRGRARARSGIHAILESNSSDDAAA
eukprot:3780196-Prymnesium_polylepis.2